MSIELNMNWDQNFKVHPCIQSERPEQIEKGIPVLLRLPSLARKHWQDISQQSAHMQGCSYPNHSLQSSCFPHSHAEICIFWGAIAS